MEQWLLHRDFKVFPENNCLSVFSLAQYWNCRFVQVIQSKKKWMNEALTVSFSTHLSLKHISYLKMLFLVCTFTGLIHVMERWCSLIRNYWRTLCSILICRQWITRLPIRARISLLKMTQQRTCMTTCRWCHRTWFVPWQMRRWSSTCSVVLCLEFCPPVWPTPLMSSRWNWLSFEIKSVLFMFK